MKKGVLAYNMVRITSFIILFILLLDGYPDQAQTCGFDKIQNHLSSENLEEKIQLELFTKEFISSKASSRTLATEGYLIPVVFHVFHEEGQEKISLGQVQNALNQVNEEFNAENSLYSTIDDQFKGIAVAADINFALAKIDPNGYPTSGVTYHNDPICVKSNGQGRSHLSRYSWDNKKYLEIYVMREVDCDGLYDSGVAWYPSTSDSNSGTAMVAYNHRYLGSIGTSAGNLPGSISSVLTHEIGHWLNLAHTFSGECGGEGDGVQDTPSIAEASHCSSDLICEVIPNYENFMDYSSGCYKMFTAGQKERMIAALNSDIGYRKQIVSEENLMATGLIDAVPVPHISVGQKTVCMAGQIQFSDNSTGNPDTYHWTFEGGDPSGSYDKSPVVTFVDQGIFSVTLSVSNQIGTSEPAHHEVIVGQGIVEPHVIDFEGFSASGNWQITTDSEHSGWQTCYGAGAEASNSSLLMDNGSGNDGTFSDLILPYMQTQNKYLTLKFQNAYAASKSQDSLKIFSQINCETNWKLISKTGSDKLVSTLVDPADLSKWFPSSRHDWKEHQAILELPEGFEQGRFKIQSKSGGGGRIFIDNIIIEGTDVLDIGFSNLEKPNIYPNPMMDYFIVSSAGVNMVLDIIDTSGKVWKSNLELKGINQKVDCEFLPPGLYLLCNQNSGKVFKIIKR